MRQFILWSTLLITTSLSAQQAYPTYEMIADHFVSLQLVRTVPEAFADGAQVSVEKRKEGWLVEQRSPTDETVSRQLLWSPEMGFQKVDKLGHVLQEHNFLMSWSAWRYDLYPYYGYPSWELDVIAAIKAQPIKTPKDNYLLGRAYYSYAGNLLSNNSGTSDSTTRYKLGTPPNAMNDMQVDIYRSYIHKGCEAYKRVVEKDPRYYTVVGTIETKLAMAYMSAFLNLRMYQNEAEAMKEIPLVNFPSYDLTTYRNVLNTCDSNAILFTAGDADTFTALYLQAAEDVRPDVLVVNMSLLRDPNYARHLMRGVLDAEPLEFSLPQPMLDKIPDGLLVDEGEAETMASTLLSEFKSDLERPIPSRLIFQCDEGEIEIQNSNRFITSDKLLFFDILNTTAGKRPIFFASKGFHQWEIDEAYLESYGITSKLTWKLERAGGDHGRIKVERMYTHLMEEMETEGFNTRLDSTSATYVVHAYLSQFTTLANLLIEASDRDRALLVLDRFQEVFPNTNYSYSLTHLNLATLYLIAGVDPQAIAVCEQVYRNAVEGRLEPEVAKQVESVLLLMADDWNIPELYPGF